MNGVKIYTFQSIKLNDDQLHEFDFEVNEYQPPYIPQITLPPLPEYPLNSSTEHKKSKSKKINPYDE